MYTIFLRDFLRPLLLIASTAAAVDPPPFLPFAIKIFAPLQQAPNQWWYVLGARDAQGDVDQRKEVNTGEKSCQNVRVGPFLKKKETNIVHTKKKMLRPGLKMPRRARRV